MSDACGRRGDRCAPQSPSRTNPSPAGADGQGARFLSSPVFPSAPLALVRQPSAEASANTPHPRPKFPFNGRRPPSASNPTLDRSPLSLAPPLASLSPSSPPSLESRGTHHIHTRPAKSRSPHPPPPPLDLRPNRQSSWCHVHLRAPGLTALARRDEHSWSVTASPAYLTDPRVHLLPDAPPACHLESPPKSPRPRRWTTLQSLSARSEAASSSSRVLRPQRGTQRPPSRRRPLHRRSAQGRSPRPSQARGGTSCPTQGVGPAREKPQEGQWVATGSSTLTFFSRGDSV